MRIAIAGGTGTVGRHASIAAHERGDEVVVLSRTAGVNARTGEGLGAALAGVDVVIDTTNAQTTDRAAASAFFTDVARTLQREAAAHGVRRIVTLSIVGLERASSYGYYAAKLVHEEQARRGSVPSTILRATQFHEFPGQVLAQTRKGPLAVVPMMRVQPVAARTVGERLVELAHAEGEQQVSEIAGPAVASLPRLARATLHARGVRAWVLAVPMPGAAGRAMRSGALLPDAGALIAGPTFEQWLAGPDGPADPTATS